MTDAPAPCYRESNGVYFTRGEHRPDCGDECRGCRPCTVGDSMNSSSIHCTARRNCTWHLAPGLLTCGRCLAATRRDLRWIGSLAALLPTAALGDGVNSEAAMLAGPAAQPEAWMWRQVKRRQDAAAKFLGGDGDA